MKRNQLLIATIITFCVFILYTLLVLVVDVQHLGPTPEATIGFGTINKWFHSFTGVHLIWFKLTEWKYILCLVIGGIYGFVGFYQLVKKKSLKQVDYNIKALGLFYIALVIFFVFFEVVEINYRPILMSSENNELVSSYPSSTTLLSSCVLITSIDQSNKYIKNKGLKSAAAITCYLLSAWFIVGRLISGVHWLTDIMGSLILSTSLILFYYLMKSVLLKIDNK